MSLKIAMLGTRGLPATYGGVEHHVEKIGEELVERGHEVTVYSQNLYSGGSRVREHHGMRVVNLPTVRVRGLEALCHSAMSTAHGLGSRHDVFHYHAVGPGLFSPLARVGSRAAIVQTVHGLDADRAKWGGGARRVLNLATWMSAHVPDRTVTVSQALADHYAGTYRTRCDVVPNGVNRKQRRSPQLITERHGLRGDDYLLFVGRLVPEKRPDLLIKAFRSVVTDKKLVLVGGSSHTDQYVAELRELAAGDPRVLMPGYLYGAELDELFTNASAFVQPSALEGLPLTLLEAMGAGVPVVASDIDPHVEIIGADGPGARLFPEGDAARLATALRRVLAAPGTERQAAVARRDDVLSSYDWSACVDSLEDVYERALHHVGRTSRPRHLAARSGATVHQFPGGPRTAVTTDEPERVRA